MSDNMLRTAIRELQLPLKNTQVICYDENGIMNHRACYINGLYNEFPISDFRDGSKKSSMVFTFFADSLQKHHSLYQQIQSRMELKSDWIHHTYDGKIHKITLTVTPSESDVQVDVLYTSAVIPPNGPAPHLTSKDILHSDYFNIFTKLNFSVSKNSL